MTRLLNNREMEMFRLLIQYAKKLDEADAGLTTCSEYIPASLQDIVNDVVEKLGFEIDEDDIAECVEEIRGS